MDMIVGEDLIQNKSQVSNKKIYFLESNSKCDWNIDKILEN